MLASDRSGLSLRSTRLSRDDAGIRDAVSWVEPFEPIRLLERSNAVSFGMPISAFAPFPVTPFDARSMVLREEDCASAMASASFALARHARTDSNP